MSREAINRTTREYRRRIREERRERVLEVHNIDLDDLARKVWAAKLAGLEVGFTPTGERVELTSHVQLANLATTKDGPVFVHLMEGRAIWQVGNVDGWEGVAAGLLIVENGARADVCQPGSPPEECRSGLFVVGGWS